MTGQIIDLAWQILLYRALDAGIQKLRCRRDVTKTVQIGGVVEDFDVAIKRRPPVYVRHERLRV